MMYDLEEMCAACGKTYGDHMGTLAMCTVGGGGQFTPATAPAGKVTSDGSTASYYELPAGATELQHLISHRDMNAQIGEIFRACYRYGQASHSDRLRDAKKIKFYIDAEIARLQKQGATHG
jgi:hypothetical protein